MESGVRTNSTNDGQVNMTWQHCCGWQGTVEEIKIEYHDGFACGASCPQCDAEWPFLFDDYESPEGDTDDPEWTLSNRQKARG